MLHKIVLIFALYISQSKESNLTDKEMLNIIGQEEYANFMHDYFVAMKEDYGIDLSLDYKNPFDVERNREKRSYGKCEIQNLYNLNSACMCQSGPHKTMVELEMINSDQSGNTLQMPRCIAIERCSSSCSMPTQKCVATKTTTVEVPVTVLSVLKSNAKECKMVKVEKHLKCGCSCGMTDKDCTEYQDFDSKSCKCRCKLHKTNMCKRPKMPNKSNCKCECPPMECSTGSFFNEDSCDCEDGDENYIR